MKNESNTQLKRSLGLSTVMLSVIGMVIGSGVFFKPQAVYTITGGAPGIGLLIWVVAGLTTLFGGLTTAELAASIPKTGGLVSCRPPKGAFYAFINIKKTGLGSEEFS